MGAGRTTCRHGAFKQACIALQSNSLRCYYLGLSHGTVPILHCLKLTGLTDQQSSLLLLPRLLPAATQSLHQNHSQRFFLGEASGSTDSPR